jgi:hypothetical protein
MVRRHFAQGKTRMIRKLLAIGYQMGFDKPQNDTEQYRMKRSDVNKLHVNRWLLSEKSAVRKEMDEMTHKELSKAVTQFEQVYKDYLTRI